MLSYLLKIPNRYSWLKTPSDLLSACPLSSWLTFSDISALKPCQTFGTWEHNLFASKILCTCCSLCLEDYFPRSLHEWFPLLFGFHIKDHWPCLIPLIKVVTILSYLWNYPISVFISSFMCLLSAFPD